MRTAYEIEAGAKDCISELRRTADRFEGALKDQMAIIHNVASLCASAIREIENGSSFPVAETARSVIADISKDEVGNCPTCETNFVSCFRAKYFKDCGHLIHKTCLRRLTGTYNPEGRLACPICHTRGYTVAINFGNAGYRNKCRKCNLDLDVGLTTQCCLFCDELYHSDCLKEFRGAPHCLHCNTIFLRCVTNKERK